MPINVNKIIGAASMAKQLGKKKTAPVAYGEVCDVILDKMHPFYSVDSNQTPGCVRVRVMPDDKGKDPMLLQWYQPLSVNDIEVPLIGEIVTLLRTGTSGLDIKNEAASYYYIKPNSCYQESHNNHLYQATANPANIQLTPEMGYYTPDKTHYPMGLVEGDKILLGRYGQCIRFTTTPGIPTINPHWKVGKAGDPILMLSVGTDVSKEVPVEDIKKGSHIVLSKGPMINDDAETKKHAITLKSEGKITNDAKEKLWLHGKEVQVNSKEWDADWTTMMDLLKDLIAEVEMLSKGTFPTGVGPTGPHPSVPGKIATIKSNWDKLKAKK